MHLNRTIRLLIWLGLAIIAVALSVHFYPKVVYRLTSGQTVRFEREVRFQLIDLGQNATLQWNLELSQGNRRLFLAPMDSLPREVYVSAADFQKCWAVPLSQLQRDSMTVVATLEGKSLLLLDGYSSVRVLDTRLIKKYPTSGK
jgi:hypothetical protein